MLDDITIVDADTSTDTSTDTGLDTSTDTSTITTTEPEPFLLDTNTSTKNEPPQPQRQDQQEEPDVKDFAGHVSSRILNLVKKSPELGQILTKNPEIRDAIEAPMRRDLAFREIFPTVAEAKAMRERFPNGLQDVQALESDVQEIEEIDNLTYNRDQDGNYPGHGKLINNVYEGDRDAAIALFKTLPKEWARLDRDSYNEVMGKIVGATLTGTGTWEQLVELREYAAGTEGLKGIVPTLDKILNRLHGFVEERQPTADDIARQRERQNWERERAQNNQQSQQQFDRTFGDNNIKLQREVIGQHKVIQRLATIKNLTPQKRQEITEKVRVKMEKFLSNSPSFMRKLKEAYQSRNINTANEIQRAAWNQQWLLNRMIRDVLKVETPQLINRNRATVQQRAGTTTVKKPDTTSRDEGKGNDNYQKRTQPFKENGMWYKANGTRMTTIEAIKHTMNLT